LLENLFDVVMLTMAAVSVLIGVRIVRDITSSTHKRRYARTAKYVLLLSFGLGIALSFYETPALIVGEATSVVILVSSLYFNLVGSRLTLHPRLRGWWFPNDSIREWFFYISLYTAVVGVASGVISVVAAYFTDLSISATVSTVYSGISVLATLVAFTIVTPNKTTIIGLVYAFSFVTRRFTEEKEVYIEDIDFEKVVTNTVYNEFDVREALESLVKQGFAVKQSPTPMGRVRFKINIYGARYLEVCWTETLIQISRQKERIEKILLYVEHRLKSLDASGSRIVVKALEEVETQKKSLIRLREDYGLAVGDSWYQKVTTKIKWLEANLREAEAHFNQKETKSKSSGRSLAMSD
jgi:acyl-CoA thioesterase FadM